MGLIRAIAAVIVGILLAYGLPWILERVLVEAMAGRNLYTAGDYYAVRNTPLIMGARVLMAVLLSVLAGHVAARVAKEDMIRTVSISASALTVMLISEFTTGEFAWGTPIWLRIVLVAITGPMMVLGAYARSTVATLQTGETQPGV